MASHPAAAYDELSAVFGMYGIIAEIGGALDNDALHALAEAEAAVAVATEANTLATQADKTEAVIDEVGDRIEKAAR